MNQSTSTVFMVRPHSFRKNEETATNNHYQRDLAQASPEEIVQRAQDEFDGLAAVLEAAGVEVIVFDEAEPQDSRRAIPEQLDLHPWRRSHWSLSNVRSQSKSGTPG